MTEIEFQFETYGHLTNGAIDNRGGKGQAQVHSPRAFVVLQVRIATNIDATRGSYKLLYNDERGLVVTAATGPDFREEFAVGQNGGTDLPPRKVSFMFHIIAEGHRVQSQQNILDSLTIGPHERANQNGILSVRMR